MTLPVLGVHEVTSAWHLTQSWPGTQETPAAWWYYHNKHFLPVVSSSGVPRTGWGASPDTEQDWITDMVRVGTRDCEKQAYVL